MSMSRAQQPQVSAVRRRSIDVVGAARGRESRSRLRLVASRSQRPLVGQVGGYETCPVVVVPESVAREKWRNGKQRNGQHTDWRASKRGDKTQEEYEALAAVSEFAVCEGYYRIPYPSHLHGDDGGQDIDFPAIGTGIGSLLLWDDASVNVRVRDWAGADPLALWPEHKDNDVDVYVWLQELTDGYPSGGMEFRVLGYIRSERVADIPLTYEDGVRDDIKDRSLHADYLCAPYDYRVERDLTPDANLAVRERGPELDTTAVPSGVDVLLGGDAP